MKKPPLLLVRPSDVADERWELSLLEAELVRVRGEVGDSKHTRKLRKLCGRKRVRIHRMERALEDARGASR